MQTREITKQQLLKEGFSKYRVKNLIKAGYFLRKEGSTLLVPDDYFIYQNEEQKISKVAPVTGGPKLNDFSSKAHLQEELEKQIIEKGRSFLKKHDYQGVLILLQNYIDRYKEPLDAQVYLLLGKAHKKNRSKDMAESFLVKAAEKDPTLSRLYLELGQSKLDQKQYSEAYNNFQKYREITNDATLIGIGKQINVAYRTKKYDKVRELLQEAYEMRERYPVAKYNRFLENCKNLFGNNPHMTIPEKVQVSKKGNKNNPSVKVEETVSFGNELVPKKMEVQFGVVSNLIDQKAPREYVEHFVSNVNLYALSYYRFCILVARKYVSVGAMEIAADYRQIAESCDYKDDALVNSICMYDAYQKRMQKKK